MKRSRSPSSSHSDLLASPSALGASCSVPAHDTVFRSSGGTDFSFQVLVEPVSAMGRALVRACGRSTFSLQALAVAADGRMSDPVSVPCVVRTTGTTMDVSVPNKSKNLPLSRRAAMWLPHAVEDQQLMAHGAEVVLRLQVHMPSEQFCVQTEPFWVRSKLNKDRAAAVGGGDAVGSEDVALLWKRYKQLGEVLQRFVKAE